MHAEKFKGSIRGEKEPLPDMKGVLEIPYSPTRSSTSRMRRVLLRESEQSEKKNYALVPFNA